MVLAIFKPGINDYSTVGILAVIVHTIFAMIIIMSNKSKDRVIILLAFLMRVFFMFWDLYARGIFVLPGSGGDSEMYYKTSVLISENLDFLGTTRGETFSDLMGVLFSVIGPQRIVGQYINVLFGLSTILIIKKILSIIKINNKTEKTILMLACFLPNSMVMSAIFIREIIPTFYVALSLFYYIKWIKQQKLNYVIFAFSSLALASMFHSGVIGIVIGYSFGLLFYDFRSNKFKFSIRTTLSFLFIVLLMTIGFTYFEDTLFGKFKNVDNISDIYSSANYREGGSAYLTGMTINNPLQLFVFGPIRSFYFLTSPLPMNWRGFSDIFTFLTDSSLYLATIIYYAINRKQFGERRSLIIILVWMIVGASFIFGIGVANAGTALRHRQKLISLFLVILALMKDAKLKNKNKLIESI